MNDLGYVFTICFVTLGPTKTIPSFFAATQNADGRTLRTLAFKSATLATLIALFVAFVATGTMAQWRVSIEALGIAGGIVLLISAVKIVSAFGLVAPAPTPDPAQVAPISARWLGMPVLSPVTIPGIIPPIGIFAILLFAAAAVGNRAFQVQFAGLLLLMMALNLVAMLFARPIMRFVGVPVLLIIGWIFAALQAGLAVQVIINSVRSLSATM